MALMGLREYARHRNCALRAVQKAIESGRIKVIQVEGERWPKIDPAQADRDWADNTDQAKQSLLHSAGADLPDDDELPPAGGADNERARAARADREEIRRDRERIELAKLQGSLIDLGEAKRLAFTAFRTLRDGLLNIPARIKDQCAAETDPMAVEALIEQELTKALAGFDLAAVTADQDDEDNDG